MTSSPVKRTASLSERLYRLLLLSYPAKFRQTYSHEMLQTFRDYRREARQRYGHWGVVRMWGHMLYDLATTACIEHIRELIANFKRVFHLEGRENITLATQFSLNVGQHTDIGRHRQSNEDNMTYVIPTVPQILAKRGALFVVADGLGGHTKGEVASEMAIRTISDVYYQDENDEIASSLQNAVKQANMRIHAEPTNTDTARMATTCVAAVLQGDTVYVANVGDSRAYIVRNGQAKQISVDHSVVEEEIRAGLITKDQAHNHPQSNMITRCLGEEPDVEVDIFSEPVQGGDLLVLCTDGIWRMVSDEELGQIVEQFGPQESVHHLIERANEQGGPDNITAIVVQVSPV